MNAKSMGHELPETSKAAPPAQVKVDIPATPEAGGEKPVTARDLAKLLMTADETTKNAIAKALKIPGIRKKPSKANRNRNHLETMRAEGEAVHEVENFLPVPPEGIIERGDEAVAAWHAAWQEGRTFSSSSMDIDDDLESIALLASE